MKPNSMAIGPGRCTLDGWIFRHASKLTTIYGNLTQTIVCFINVAGVIRNCFGYL